MAICYASKLEPFGAAIVFLAAIAFHAWRLQSTWRQLEAGALAIIAGALLSAPVWTPKLPTMFGDDTSRAPSIRWGVLIAIYGIGHGLVLWREAAKIRNRGESIRSHWLRGS